MSQYGPYPPPDPRYGQYPPPPGHQPAPTPHVEPPTPVVYARALIFLSVGLTMLRLILVIFVVGIPEANEDSRLSESLETALVAVGLGFAIGITALWVVIAIFIMRAANWARIVALVLSTLDVLGVVIFFATYGTAEPQLPLGIDVLDIARSLIVIAATILLWIPASNRFFRIPMYVRRGWPLPPG